jgi:hypothetical protein
MLDLIVNFINQGVPIGQVTTTLLKIRRFDQTFQQHRRKMKAVIRTPQGQQISSTNILYSTQDYKQKESRTRALEEGGV